MEKRRVGKEELAESAEQVREEILKRWIVS
jgi:hypothetical protein